MSYKVSDYKVSEGYRLDDTIDGIAEKAEELVVNHGEVCSEAAIAAFKVYVEKSLREMLGEIG